MALQKVNRNLLNTGVSDSSDATAITIDSSENVGIGTTSPAYKIDSRVSTSASIVAGLNLDASGNNNGDGSAINFSRAGNALSSVAKISTVKAEVSNNETDLVFSNYAAGSLTEKMRIVGATGNVGIGTTSPAGILHANSSGHTKTYITGGTSNDAQINFGDSDDNDIGGIHYDNAQNSMKFLTNTAERMRIDSSGNLLIGKTSTDAGSTAGVELRGGIGFAAISRSGDVVANFSRLTNDGNIVAFRKDSTDVGHIGANGGMLTIGGGDCGLYFEAGTTNVLFPYNPSASSTSDNDITIGWSSNRFKDLFLSGGVYLGGTGSANKLDDYEEGSWTPRITSSSGTAFTSPSATYTKIGRLVTIRFDITNNTGTGTSLIYGLPFSTSGHGSFHITWNNQGDRNHIGAYNNSGSMQLIESGSTTSWSLGNGERILGFGLYFTDD